MLASNTASKRAGARQIGHALDGDAADLSPTGADAADLEQAQLLKSTYSDTNTRQNNRRLNKRTGFCIFGVVLFLFWVYLVEVHSTFLARSHVCKLNNSLGW